MIGELLDKNWIFGSDGRRWGWDGFWFWRVKWEGRFEWINWYKLLYFFDVINLLRIVLRYGLCLIGRKYYKEEKVVVFVLVFFIVGIRSILVIEL